MDINKQMKNIMIGFDHAAYLREYFYNMSDTRILEIWTGDLEMSAEGLDRDDIVDNLTNYFADYEGKLP